MSVTYRTPPDGSLNDEHLYQCSLLLDRCVQLEERKEDEEHREDEAMKAVLDVCAELRASKASLASAATALLMAIIFKAPWFVEAVLMCALVIGSNKTTQLGKAKAVALSLHREAQMDASHAAAASRAAWLKLMTMTVPVLIRPIPIVDGGYHPPSSIAEES